MSVSTSQTTPGAASPGTDPNGTTGAPTGAGAPGAAGAPAAGTRWMRILALTGIVGGQLMLVVDGTIVTVALPHIREQLGFSPAELTWAMNSYALVFGGLLMLGGRIGDIVGRKRALVIGVIVFAIGSFAGGFATESWMLIASRVVQAIGGALAAPSTLALLRSNFPAGPAQNRALSFFSLAAGTGGAIGLVLGGLLTSTLGWNWVMFINVPIALVVVLAASFGLKESDVQPGRFDVPGAVLVTLGVTALVNGLINVAVAGWLAPLTLISLALGLGMLVAFVLVEKRSTHPLLPLRLLGSAARVAPYAAMLLVPAGMFGFFYTTTLFLEDVLGFDAMTTGVAILPWVAGMFTMSQLAPRILRTVSAPTLAFFGLGAMPVALFWMSFLRADSDYWVALFGPLLLLGASAGATFLPLTLLVLGGATEKDASAASGLLQTLQQVGGAIGIAVLTVVYASVVGQDADDASTSQGIQAALLTSTLIALLALVVFTVARIVATRGARR
ncbi:MFS transporter [Compostimonas suwonensis]|uniref:EmrB/QacA subfamily drug resistance transporter n=1 Tax=Compostimonas suwonensis TaxID=1048394 RepID=A0A2M9C4G4_9MICO|nr:MFS transporter [Compostimonas suwonensis]PJJ65418.1 EmrB/QacA subfamily drug resistance transporter [Compostimonas suwonensis]